MCRINETANATNTQNLPLHYTHGKIQSASLEKRTPTEMEDLSADSNTNETRILSNDQALLTLRNRFFLC